MTATAENPAANSKRAIDPEHAITVLDNGDTGVRFRRLRESVLMGLVRKLPDTPFSVVVHLRFHHKLRFFRRPRAYSELVVHKKLTNRDPLLTRTADKYEARAYVSEKVGDKYLIPLQQVVEHPADIDFDSLKGTVVMKASHGCNMTMVIDTSKPIPRAAVRATGHRWLKTNWFDMWKEWAYKDMTPRLVIEDFIGVDGKPPVDYKFHVFNGRVELVQVDTGRFTAHRSTMFTPQWRRLRVSSSFGVDAQPIQRPAGLEEMVEVARKLGKDFDYARVDLYDVDGRIYFGEITHYPGAASVSIEPPQFDRVLGDLWRIGAPVPERYFTP